MEPQTPPNTRRDPMIGTTIANKFAITKLIGEGSMGAIYQATHLSLDKRIALKVIHRHLLGDEELVHRFHREARAASKLRHPNCVQILDFGQTETGVLYLAMEFIDGRTLSQIVDSNHPLAIDRVITIATQICQALDEAHAKGVLHRDLKPDNVMIEDLRNLKDRVRVVDFGIAKLQGDTRSGEFQTKTGVVCGTPEYMSPEQLRGEHLDARSDIYALGCLIYFILCNRVPHQGESPLDTAMAHLGEDRPAIVDRPEGIVQAFNSLLDSMFEKKRERRPTSVMDVHAELKRIERDLAARSNRTIQQPLADDATLIDAGGMHAAAIARAIDAAAVGNAETEVATGIPASMRPSVQEAMATSGRESLAIPASTLRRGKIGRDVQAEATLSAPGPTPPKTPKAVKGRKNKRTRSVVMIAVGLTAIAVAAAAAGWWLMGLLSRT